MASAPIHVHARDNGSDLWPATRQGEPSFTGVQDLEDLYAAALSRDCYIVISDEVWIQMNDGIRAIRPSDVHRP
jgi:hypothetical protein